MRSRGLHKNDPTIQFTEKGTATTLRTLMVLPLIAIALGLVGAGVIIGQFTEIVKLETFALYLITFTSGLSAIACAGAFLVRIHRLIPDAKIEETRLALAKELLIVAIVVGAIVAPFGIFFFCQMFI